MDQEPDDLRRQLKSWEVDVSVPSAFQAGVWQRIAAREEKRSSAPWRRFQEALLVSLSRPAYATAVLVASISLGLGVAHVQADAENAKHWRELEARYVKSVTPMLPPSS